MWLMNESTKQSPWLQLCVDIFYCSHADGESSAMELIDLCSSLDNEKGIFPFRSFRF